MESSAMFMRIRSLLLSALFFPDAHFHTFPKFGDAGGHDLVTACESIDDKMSSEPVISPTVTAV